MSFRIEEKLSISRESLLDFKVFLNKNSAKRIYNTRTVESLYFENNNLQMFNDSIEGLLPRKKIRIRNYPLEKKNTYALEYKISSVEGRYKTKKILKSFEVENFINLGILDQQYGVCYPSINIKFIRDYYLMNDVRITIDQDIMYRKFTSKNKKNDHKIIVELKAAITKDSDDLIKSFPMQRTRFSKYCNGVTLLKI